MKIETDHKFTGTLDNLLLHWARQGIKINPGISEETINEIEKELNVNLEENFCKYLKRVNGFVDFESDKAWFSFWSITRMKEENSDRSHPENVFWFSDHAINLCSFGFHTTDKKIYTHFEKSNEILLIANSFSEFVDLYLADPYQLIL